jgi:hypothetical protein
MLFRTSLVVPDCNKVSENEKTTGNSYICYVVAVPAQKAYLICDGTNGDDFPSAWKRPSEVLDNFTPRIDISEHVNGGIKDTGGDRSNMSEGVQLLFIATVTGQPSSSTDEPEYVICVGLKSQVGFRAGSPPP